MVFFRFFSLITISFIFLAATTQVFGAGEDPATLSDINNVFKTVITSVAIIGGFLAFIAFIIGGFKYITARGDPKAVAGAQAALTWAVIGLILIIVAWLILVFISKFTDVNVTEFNFQSPFPD